MKQKRKHAIRIKNVHIKKYFNIAKYTSSYIRVEILYKKKCHDFQKHEIFKTFKTKSSSKEP